MVKYSRDLLERLAWNMRLSKRKRDIKAMRTETLEWLLESYLVEHSEELKQYVVESEGE